MGARQTKDNDMAQRQAIGSFYERNKQVIQCTVGGLVGGLALGAMLMYARTKTGKTMRRTVKRSFAKKLPKFSDLYPDTASARSATPKAQDIYNKLQTKYNL